MADSISLRKNFELAIISLRLWTVSGSLEPEREVVGFGVTNSDEVLSKSERMATTSMLRKGFVAAYTGTSNGAHRFTGGDI